MENPYTPIAGQLARVSRPAASVLLLHLLWLALLALPGLGWAQVPAWQLAMSGGNSQTGITITRATAVDARGNVFVTGRFNGSVAFGNTQLVSVGINDAFVAKWDATAHAFVWATSGGGTGEDVGNGIAVSGTSVFVTGSFTSNSNAHFANQALAGAGGVDVFVTKYIDTSTGHTPATSSFANAWATGGGGTGEDVGNGIAVSGTSVFATGSFTSSRNAQFAGQALVGAGFTDVFVAKYVDTSTGNTPATSSFANGWATSGGGTGDDSGYGIAVSGTGVFVTGNFDSGSNASIAGQALTGAGYYDVFVAKYVDTSTGSTPATSSFANAWATSGGGANYDQGYGIAVNGRNVFVTGNFNSGFNASFAGQALTGAGLLDVFVAKYVDTSTGNTPATSSFANAWATSGGGTANEGGMGIAVSGNNVFVTGTFASGTGTSLAGQMLTGLGGGDVFVAKYVDTSTGSTPATSSFANAWATSGGSTSTDVGLGIAVSGQQVYTVGSVTTPASFGNLTLSNMTSARVDFLASLTDLTLPLAARPETLAEAGQTLYPNPAPGGAATLRGSAPGMAVQVVDALGRVVATATADAAGTATWSAGLQPGVYVVRAGTRALRLTVE